MKIEVDWKPISQIPQEWSEPIIIINEYNKLQTFKNTIGKVVKEVRDGKNIYDYYSNFENLVKKYKIKYWAYEYEFVIDES